MAIAVLIIGILLLWLIWQTIEYETESKAAHNALARLIRNYKDH